MSVHLTNKSFRSVVVASGLLTEERLDEVQREFPDETTTPQNWSDKLIEQGDLTKWQAEKLMQGRHRGFQLGQFQLRSRLARGGMSTIYVAREKGSTTDCVLKVLPLKRVCEASYLPRFQREARIAAGLNHPHVIQVYGLHCESDGKADIHFIAMEYLEGDNLSELVRRDGPLSLRTAARVMIQAAKGLAYAHDAGLVHRDVKPGNFVLTTDNILKVLDLGLASANHPDEEDLTRKYDERVLGTADYLSPEQAVDSHKADARADIYALGCTLYFLLTGRPPFPDGSLAERILAHQTKQPVPIDRCRPDVTEEFRQIMDQMLLKDREQRIQSANEVAEQFSSWLEAVEGDLQFDQRPDSDTIEQMKQINPTSMARTRTDTDPFHSASSPGAHGDSALSGVYTREFESFLMQLDEESGFDTVIDSKSRKRQLKTMSELRDARRRYRRRGG